MNDPSDCGNMIGKGKMKGDKIQCIDGIDLWELRGLESSEGSSMDCDDPSSATGFKPGKGGTKGSGSGSDDVSICWMDLGVSKPTIPHTSLLFVSSRAECAAAPNRRKMIGRAT